MQQLLLALPDLQPEAQRGRQVTAKLSYKDQMDILWSLEQTAERLESDARDWDKYKSAEAGKARESAARLRKLRERLGGTW